MALKRDGDIVTEGRISGEDQERALFGFRRKRRPSQDPREAALGYVKLEVDTEGLERDLLRPNVGPAVNDGMAFEGHATRPGEAPEPGRVNRLAEARQAAGYPTVEALAVEAAMPPKLIARYEDPESKYTDAYYVPEAHRAALAIALDLAEDDLFPRRVAGQGLPSLIRTGKLRPGKRVTQADLGAEHERRSAKLLAERQEARSAAELESIHNQLLQVQRDLEAAELTDRADALGRKIDAVA